MTKTLHLPVNRVEGDLELRLALEEDHVSDAWSVGTSYRGFENILVGRAPLDALVITPRVCGMCSLAHLTAAARALDGIVGAELPDNAIRLRNVALGAELVQSDVRHTVLMFAPDLTNPVHGDNPHYAEAVERYRPFAGRSTLEVIRQTKQLVEVIAILGGQWPHSEFMVPGGVVSTPDRSDLLAARQLLRTFTRWYERQVLGCSLERWRAVSSSAGLDAWLDERPEHAASDVGFLLRFGRAAQLDRIGRAHDNFVSFGALELPRETAVTAGTERFIPAGFFRAGRPEPFQEDKISEDVSSSWFDDEQPARHPFDGLTRPYATGDEAARYSWAKAPRYAAAPAEAGPLAELVVAEDPLFSDLVRAEGGNVLVRQLARLVRGAWLLPALESWVEEMSTDRGPFFFDPKREPEVGQSSGLVEATRGGLGHWVKIVDGKIDRYQIITPTTWNASPRDGASVRGPWEEALVGTPLRDAENPVEAGHIVRSFDACMVCCVHTLRRGELVGRVSL